MSISLSVVPLIDMTRATFFHHRRSWSGVFFHILLLTETICPLSDAHGCPVIGSTIFET